MPSLIRSCLLASCVVIAACDSSSSSRNPAPEPEPPEPAPEFSAEIRRTEFGIPHIKADDWGSLGYGYGYAYSQDNYCVTMREIVIAGGRSAELMGEAEGDVERDLLFRFLNGSKAEFEEEIVGSLPDNVRSLIRGFAAGMNRYLRDTGVENLAEGDAGCRNANWVFEVDDIDLMQHLRRIALGGSSDQGLVRNALLAVQPPPQAFAASELVELQAPLLASLERAGSDIRPRFGQVGDDWRWD